MKKFVLAALCLFVTAGLIVAASVTGIVSKVDAEKKTITLKVDDKEVEYTWTDKTTIKSGEKDVPSEIALKMLSNPKAAGKMKIEVVADDKKVISEIKLPERKKKDKN
jgi:archaellin